MSIKTVKTKSDEGKVINSGPKLGERYITSLLQTMLSFGLLQQDDKDDYHRKVLYTHLTPPGDIQYLSHPNSPTYSTTVTHTSEDGFLLLLLFDLDCSSWMMTMIFIGPRYTWGPIYGSQVSVTN